jgi:carbonic anhydrase
LFITCSDSRIAPDLLTQTEPGELFILRNAGNLVPPFGGPPGAEAATIEYAIVQLRVHDIILCGHSKCGAMHGLLEPEALGKLPSVGGWLEHARALLPELQSAGNLSEDDKLKLAIEKNVLLQMEHLKTHPAVANALAARALRLHAAAWLGVSLREGARGCLRSGERPIRAVGSAGPPEVAGKRRTGCRAAHRVGYPYLNQAQFIETESR